MTTQIFMLHISIFSVVRKGGEERGCDSLYHITSNIYNIYINAAKIALGVCS